MSDPLNPRDLIRPGALGLQRRLMTIIERRDAITDPNTGQAPHGWMLALRPLLRESMAGDLVRRRQELALLLRDGDPRVRPMVVWLLGRCASRFKLRGIENCTLDCDPATRKQVAKALKRLEAADRLQEMAAAWPHDAWVQRYARRVVAPPSPFAERLARYVAHTGGDTDVALTPGPSRMPYWARDARWFLSPPKSPWSIRRLLLRIQRWVHG